MSELRMNAASGHGAGFLARINDNKVLWVVRFDPERLRWESFGPNQRPMGVCTWQTLQSLVTQGRQYLSLCQPTGRGTFFIKSSEAVYLVLGLDCEPWLIAALAPNAELPDTLDLG